MESISEWLRTQFGMSPVMQGRVVSSLMWILVLWLSRRLIMLGVGRTVKDQGIHYRWSKATQYVAVVLGFIGIASIWSAVLRGVATYLGLVSAGLAIALKDILTNMAGWGFIV